MEISEIVKKLVGSIEPYGDTWIDKERAINLNEHISLTNDLVRDLINTARFKDRDEDSIRNMGNSAYIELLELKEMIDKEIEN